MPDQADKLRQLMRDTAPRRDGDGPPMVAVTGGKGGVGATTVAVNLAAALAQGGNRVVLVDAAKQHADLAGVAGIDAATGPSLGDVLAGRCSAGDALVPGPAGALLLADRWAPESPPDWSPAADERLLAGLQDLDLWADILVVDTGSGAMPWTSRLWQRARLALVVTTVDDVAVMDTYATIKRCAAEMQTGSDIRVLANRCDSRRAATDACGRIDNVCRRFLARSVGQATALPPEAGAAERCVPRIWVAPRSPFARAVRQLSGAVTAAVAARPARVSA